MKRFDLKKIGVPDSCLDVATEFIAKAGRTGAFSNPRRFGSGETNSKPREIVERILANPSDYISDPMSRKFAEALIEDAKIPAPRAPIIFPIWGEDIIDLNAIQQMHDVCQSSIIEKAAIMPDSHLGYTVPIGGVVATLNAVIPAAVGVDIACRMKMTILDLAPLDLEKRRKQFREAIITETAFGKGCEWETKRQHDVMDADWKVSPITRRLKDTAHRQLGTSGSGNHYCDVGIITVYKPIQGLEVGKSYVAVVTHSGSRGTGAKVCQYYSKLAVSKRSKNDTSGVYWLDLDSEEGQEYWAAMNLMGDYAAANHDCIHRALAANLGAQIIANIENHHNFAWKEIHDGREYIVHRKGATPAGEGVLGVIPGSMASPAFVVSGKGNAASLRSASHGAGRKHGRNAAKAMFKWDYWKDEIKRRGVELISSGIDEVPGVYKEIEEVMARQQDLVDIIARFDPKIVRMADEGEQAED
jgi:tRNA-splicing ligase RtcB